jgi:hypothetical protein
MRKAVTTKEARKIRAANGDSDALTRRAKLLAYRRPEMSDAQAARKRIMAEGVAAAAASRARTRNVKRLT